MPIRAIIRCGLAALFAAAALTGTSAHAQTRAECEEAYQQIFGALNNIRPDGARAVNRKVSNAEISWALSYEKAKRAGKPCTSLPANSAPTVASSPQHVRLINEGRAAIARKDDIMARRKFREACALGSGEACAFEGSFVAAGRGGAQDTEASIALFRKACGLKHEPACELIEGATADTTRKRETNEAKIASVGGFLKAGDKAGAEAVLKETCDASYARGCGLYASFLRGVIKSNDTARIERIRKKACELGDKQSCK